MWSSTAVVVASTVEVVKFDTTKTHQCSYHKAVSTVKHIMYNTATRSSRTSGFSHLVLQNNASAFPARSCARCGVFPITIEFLLQGHHRCHSVVRQMGLVEYVGVLSIWIAVAIVTSFGPGGGCRWWCKSREVCRRRSCRRSVFIWRLEWSLAATAPMIVSRKIHEGIDHTAAPRGAVPVGRRARAALQPKTMTSQRLRVGVPWYQGEPTRYLNSPEVGARRVPYCSTSSLLPPLTEAFEDESHSSDRRIKCWLSLSTSAQAYVENIPRSTRFSPRKKASTSGFRGPGTAPECNRLHRAEIGGERRVYRKQQCLRGDDWCLRAGKWPSLLEAKRKTSSNGRGRELWRRPKPRAPQEAPPPARSKRKSRSRRRKR